MDSFKIVDENGVEHVADFISAFSYKDHEYVIYSIDKDNGEVDVLVSQLLKDNDGNDIICDIEDESIREDVKKIVEDIINNLE